MEIQHQSQAAQSLTLVNSESYYLLSPCCKTGNCATYINKSWNPLVASGRNPAPTSLTQKGNVMDIHLNSETTLKTLE